MKKCPVCGKEFDVLWPDLWAYRENGRFICTWKCLRQLRKEADEKMYTKVKKDGTPAKKSGPKKAAEKAEKVTLVYDPSIAEEYQREQAEKKLTAEDLQRYEETTITHQMKKQYEELEKKIQGRKQLEIAAVLSDVITNGRYLKTMNGTRMRIENDRTIGFEMTAREWIEFSEEIRVAMEQLGIRAEDPEDYTGNNGPL